MVGAVGVGELVRGVWEGDMAGGIGEGCFGEGGVEVGWHCHGGNVGSIVTY